MGIRLDEVVLYSGIWNFPMKGTNKWTGASMTIKEYLSDMLNVSFSTRKVQFC